MGVPPGTYSVSWLQVTTILWIPEICQYGCETCYCECVCGGEDYLMKEEIKIFQKTTATCSRQSLTWSFESSKGASIIAVIELNASSLWLVSLVFSFLLPFPRLRTFQYYVALLNKHYVQPSSEQAPPLDLLQEDLSLIWSFRSSNGAPMLLVLLF